MGGIGHAWVKRLFIDQKYIVDEENPERTEDPKDYTFIPATVEDNKWLLKSSPMYLRNLSNMPEEMVKAFRYGDWNAMSGAYFKNFNRATHVKKPFKIPPHWPVYRSFDYGLDCFSVGWWAVDEDGRSWLIRHYEHKDLIVQDAAAQVLSHTLPSEKVLATYAPPDMFWRDRNITKTTAEMFLQCGVNVIKSDNNRVQGHMVMKDMMAPMPVKDKYLKSLFPDEDKLPGFMVFSTCEDAIEDIESIQADDNNPSDCAKSPHEVTHAVDMCRYYCISRVAAAEAERQRAENYYDEEERGHSYEDFMCGGAASSEYMGY